MAVLIKRNHRWHKNQEIHDAIERFLEAIEDTHTMSGKELTRLLQRFSLSRLENRVRAILYELGWMSYAQGEEDEEHWQRDNIGEGKLQTPQIK